MRDEQKRSGKPMLGAGASASSSSSSSSAATAANSAYALAAAAHPSASVVATSHVERAMSCIDRYLCSRLFAVMFPNDRSPDSFEDERLRWKLKSLTWLEPRHLLIAQIPAQPKV